ncbi:glucoamylase [Kitasatospora sp. MAP12-15]|uniref:glycoside hydrolase family 15 protein n=1 Tax=unclassified Kitasatospora TaxID=2633591 RepID=UPI0024768AF9|nr:glycoside hydrolase family 15 protein [Kitasatospora sp. MAP12-44]MDH6115273.1 glucoamylase [Kitasatospora sp. MAP12-44]
MTSSRGRRRPWQRRTALLTAGLTLAAAALTASAGVAAAATAPGGPGVNAVWNEPHVQGFADAIQANSKVWYSLGDGQLENVMYPQVDNPDTFGLQYYVTDGSTFTDNEVANTSHAISLVDPTSLEWKQTNTAANGKYTITKSYVADPARSVVLINTTFTNLSSSPLYLYAQYSPALNNDGMGNSGGTDASGDLTASNGSVASAMAASTGFTATNTGYAGTASDGASLLVANRNLSTAYSGVSAAGHLTQTGQVPVAAGGSTAFTLALGFDTTTGAAVSDATASLSGGFAAAETSFQSGWHSWLAGLHAAPASVTGNAKLLQQYDVSLMEVKADEDKNYVGGFVAAPNTPWGAGVLANSAGQHGYHLVWTRDEFQMASTLLAAGDSTDANDALSYILGYEETSSGYVKQNSWLNGTQVWGGTQLDQVAFPAILAYQLGRTDAATWAKIKTLADYLVANGPRTGQERWEENGGYSPSTMAAEVAGLVCAANLATANGDSTDAAGYLKTADTFQAAVDADTYTTSGPIGNGSYYVRITPNGNPNASDTVNIANGGGSFDQRAIVDQGFLELSRLGVKPPGSAQITNSLAAVDSTIRTVIPGYGTYFNRYNHDGYGETSTGADYTGAGVGRPWPVLSGERGEYDVQVGNTTDADAMLSSMANAANAGYQISEQIWPTASADGFTQGQPDNSSTPLMWAMAQYVRLAIDISAGRTVETPAVVAQRYAGGGGGTVSEKVTVTVPVDTDASGQTVYLEGNLSALGEGQSDWAANGIAMTRLDATHWTTTVNAAANATLAYKYDLGGNWNNAEESTSCAGVGNRSMPVNRGTATDTVGNWQGPGTCGSAAAVITVTVPANTPSTATVHLSGDFSALGTGMAAANDWNAALYPMTKVDATHWTLTVTSVPGATLQYKYTLGSWSNVEEGGGCGYVGNRSFAFQGAATSYPASDTVSAWQGLNGC